MANARRAPSLAPPIPRRKKVVQKQGKPVAPNLASPPVAVVQLLQVEEEEEENALRNE